MKWKYCKSCGWLLWVQVSLYSLCMDWIDTSSWNGCTEKLQSENNMPRTKGQSAAVVVVRADLEAALGALADHGECAPRVMLRIRQAAKRTGLYDLLNPALEDMERMVRDVDDAKSQVLCAVNRMTQ